MPPAPPVEDVVVGAELQRILRKCLAKEPDSRYQGMRDLVVDLRQLRASITSSETMSRPVEPTRESVTGRWRRPPVWIGAAVLAAAIAAAILWAVRRDGGPAISPSEAAARPAVAVVAFEVIGGSPDMAWLAKGLPSMLITGLAQTPDIEVVGNERLGDAARQVGASTLDGVARSQLAEVSRRAGARFIIIGTIIQTAARRYKPLMSPRNGPSMTASLKRWSPHTWPKRSLPSNGATVLASRGTLARPSS